MLVDEIGGLLEAYKCIHLGFLELLAKVSNSLRLPETVKPTHSGLANWRVGQNCDDLQMRSPGLSRAPSQGKQLSPAPRNREANAFRACKLEGWTKLWGPANGFGGCEGWNWRAEKLVWNHTCKITLESKVWYHVNMANKPKIRTITMLSDSI